MSLPPPGVCRAPKCKRKLHIQDPHVTCFRCLGVTHFPADCTLCSLYPEAELVTRKLRHSVWVASAAKQPPARTLTTDSLKHLLVTYASKTDVLEDQCEDQTPDLGSDPGQTSHTPSSENRGAGLFGTNVGLQEFVPHSPPAQLVSLSGDLDKPATRRNSTGLKDPPLVSPPSQEGLYQVGRGEGGDVSLSHGSDFPLPSSEHSGFTRDKHSLPRGGTLQACFSPAPSLGEKGAMGGDDQVLTTEDSFQSVTNLLSSQQVPPPVTDTLSTQRAVSWPGSSGQLLGRGHSHLASASATLATSMGGNSWSGSADQPYIGSVSSFNPVKRAPLVGEQFGTAPPHTGVPPQGGVFDQGMKTLAPQPAVYISGQGLTAGMLQGQNELFRQTLPAPQTGLFATQTQTKGQSVDSLLADFAAKQAIVMDARFGALETMIAALAHSAQSTGSAVAQPAGIATQAAVQGMQPLPVAPAVHVDSVPVPVLVTPAPRGSGLPASVSASESDTDDCDDCPTPEETLSMDAPSYQDVLHYVSLVLEDPSLLHIAPSPPADPAKDFASARRDKQPTACLRLDSHRSQELRDACIANASTVAVDRKSIFKFADADYAELFDRPKLDAPLGESIRRAVTTKGPHITFQRTQIRDWALALSPIYQGAMDAYRLAYHQLVLTRALGESLTEQSAYQTQMLRLMVSGSLESLHSSTTTALAVIRQMRAMLLAVSDYAVNTTLVKSMIASPYTGTFIGGRPFWEAAVVKSKEVAEEKSVRALLLQPQPQPKRQRLNPSGVAPARQSQRSAGRGQASAAQLAQRTKEERWAAKPKPQHKPKPTPAGRGRGRGRGRGGHKSK